MTLCPKVLSIQVGRPRQFDSLDTAAVGSAKPWTSGIIKEPIVGSVLVRQTNIEGDEQADLVHHGGPDKAVLACPSEHFTFWRSEYSSHTWQNGCFGENLTLSGAVEKDVCIGDIFSIGSAVLQISQPRQPCWKLSRRWNLPKLAVLVQQSRRTGWYLRVIEEGVIEAGMVMNLVERHHPQWTIAVANEIMFSKPRDPNADAALAGCEFLSASWRETLSSRYARGRADGEDRERKRLKG